MLTDKWFQTHTHRHDHVPDQDQEVDHEEVDHIHLLGVVVVAHLGPEVDRSKLKLLFLTWK